MFIHFVYLAWECTVHSFVSFTAIIHIIGIRYDFKGVYSCILFSINFHLFRSVYSFQLKTEKCVVLRCSLFTHLIGFHKYGCICFFLLLLRDFNWWGEKKRTGICLYLYATIFKFNKTTTHSHIVIWWRTANIDTDTDTNLPTQPNIYI